jgi:4-amino-4-deoxy-L-arabinose transferase-like glycosyltransferase
MSKTVHPKILLFMKKFFELYGFILIIIGYFVIIFITNKWGIGFSPDSAGYLAGARSIISGKGISFIYDLYGNPLKTWLPYMDNETLNLFPWPPFFPLILSVFGFIKINLVLAGRMLIAVLFGANIFLVTHIVKKYLKSYFLMAFAFIFLITSRDMIQIHSMLWSEPLFIFLSLLGFVFLFDFLENNKIIFLLAASLFFSLANFTRTIGISLIAVCAVAVLFYSELKIKKRIIYSGISILIGFLPFAIWTLINKFIYNSSPAELIFRPIRVIYYAKILNTISLWVFNNKTSEKIRIILIAVLIIIIISMASFIAFKNKKRYMEKNYKINSKITGILLFFILFYLAALLFGRIFFDESIVIDDIRMLIPVLISIFIIFLFFLKRFTDFYFAKENVKILAYVFCGFLIATSFSNNNAVELYKNGQWYSNEVWFQSETIKELKIQQAQIPIYTNEPGAIYLFLGRNPNYLPIKQNIHTSRENPNYQKDLDKIMKEIKEKDGLLVLFDRGWGVFPKEEEIIKNYKLFLLKDTSDGAIYKIKN